MGFVSLNNYYNRSNLGPTLKKFSKVVPAMIVWFFQIDYRIKCFFTMIFTKICCSLQYEVIEWF